MLRSHRVMIVLLISAGILNYADRQIIALLKPMLSAELGWSDSDYGTLTAAYQLAAAGAFLFAGRLVDRIGVRWANPLSVGSWSLAAIGHAAATTLSQFVGMRVLLGVTEAMGTPTAIKTIAAAFESRDRPLVIGIMNASGSAGAILAPLTIPFVAQAVGWRISFTIAGGLGLIWAAVWWRLSGRMVWGHAEAAKPAQGPLPWREILSDRRTWAIAGAKVLSDQTWWFLLYWTPDLFRRLFHLNTTGAAIPLALIYSAAALGSLLGGTSFHFLTAENRLSFAGARRRIFLTCGLLALPLPLLPGHGLWTAVALLALILAAHQGFSSNLFSLITDIVPDSRIGLISAIGALSGNLAGMAVLQITGWVLDSGGGFTPMLCASAVSYLLAFVWLLGWLPELRTGPAKREAGLG